MVKAMYKYKYPISAPVDAIGVNISIDEKIPDTIAMYRTVSKTIRTRKYFDNEKRMWTIESYDLIKHDAVTELYKEIPRKGLVGEWLFFERQGDRLHDTSGVNPPNDGTIYGMVWDTLPSGKVVGSFDGIDDYVRIPYIINPATTDWTVLVWFKTSILPSAKGEDMIVLQQMDGTGIGRSWIILRSVDNTINSFLGGSYRPSGVIVQVDKWYFVGLKWDNTANTLQWYINGKVKNTYTFKVENATGDHLLGVHKSLSFWFEGLIGITRIYNRTLTEDEIESIYKLEAPLFGIAP